MYVVNYLNIKENSTNNSIHKINNISTKLSKTIKFS